MRNPFFKPSPPQAKDPVKELIDICAHPLDTSSLPSVLTALREPVWWPSLERSLAQGTYPYAALNALPFSKDSVIIDLATRTLRSAKHWMRDTICSAIVLHTTDIEQWPTRERWLQHIQRAAWGLDNKDVPHRPMEWQYHATRHDAQHYVQQMAPQMWCRDVGLELFCTECAAACVQQQSIVATYAYPQGLLEGPVSFTRSFRNALLYIQLAVYMEPIHSHRLSQPVRAQWPDAYARIQQALEAYAVLEYRPWREFLMPFKAAPSLQSFFYFVSNEMEPYLRNILEEPMLLTNTLAQIGPE